MWTFLVCVFLGVLSIAAVVRNWISLELINLEQTENVCANPNVHQLLVANGSCTAFRAPVTHDVITNRTLVLSASLPEVFDHTKRVWKAHFRNTLSTDDVDVRAPHAPLVLVTTNETDARRHLPHMGREDILIFWPGTQLTIGGVDAIVADLQGAVILCEEKRPNKNLWHLYEESKRVGVQVAMLTLRKAPDSPIFLQPLLSFVKAMR